MLLIRKKIFDLAIFLSERIILSKSRKDSWQIHVDSRLFYMGLEITVFIFR